MTPLKYSGRWLHWEDQWLERQIRGEVSNIPWILMKGLDLTVDGEQWWDIKKFMSLFTWQLHLRRIHSWQLHCQTGLQSLRSWFSFSTIKMKYRAARYAPMNLATIPGYPNKITLVYWKTYLWTFNDEKGDDASIHLFSFHKHIHKLGVGWHEDSSNKLFMYSL